MKILSSYIAAVQYNEADRTLRVEFRDGTASCLYYEVPAAIYAAFMKADSKGAYFNAAIRNSFRYVRDA